MSSAPQPDYASESRIVQIPASALVAMRDANATYVDTANFLGLGNRDLLDLRLPKFQRGLKWNEEKLTNFHASLMQGWPIGVLVIAVQESKLLDPTTGQSQYTLSLIDGQQRSWALRQLIREFWSQPWIEFLNEKWASAGPASGPIHDAGKAIGQLAPSLGVTSEDLESLTNKVAQEHGRSAFEFHTDYLDALKKLGVSPAAVRKKAVQKPANELCKAVIVQYQSLCNIKVPALLLGEALEPQLPSIFRRLNEGVPLKGYDLLAAMWDSAALVPQGSKPDRRRTAQLKEILEVAATRITSTYEGSGSGSGYELDPNAEPIEMEDLSLFDLLNYLGPKMRGKSNTFDLNTEDLAFQTSALVLRGSIGLVDDKLRKVFPVGPDGSPDLDLLPRLFVEATANIESALRQLMDVHVSTFTVRGQLGLTSTVVYASAFLTHHNQIRENGARLEVVRRGQSAQDRHVRPGFSLTSTEREAAMRRNLPAWYVLDSLSSAFSGSRAYETATNRIWAEFRTVGKASQPSLKVSNVMLEQPTLQSLLDVFQALWMTECSGDKTPQRRRISGGGSVLFRAAFSHVATADHVVDHVVAFKKGVVSASANAEVYPLNHVANLMPLAELINGKRKDAPWDKFFNSLTTKEKTSVKKVLLIDPNEAPESVLSSRIKFEDFLRLRYRALVSQVLSNLDVDEWTKLRPAQQKKKLASLAR